MDLGRILPLVWGLLTSCLQSGPCFVSPKVGTYALPIYVFIYLEGRCMDSVNRMILPR